MARLVYAIKDFTEKTLYNILRKITALKIIVQNDETFQWAYFC